MKRKCNENEENDHQREHALIFYQILSTNSVRKFYGDQSGEFVCGHWG